MAGVVSSNKMRRKDNLILEAGKATNSGVKTIRRALKTDKKILKRKWIIKEFKRMGKQ